MTKHGAKASAITAGGAHIARGTKVLDPEMKKLLRDFRREKLAVLNKFDLAKFLDWEERNVGRFFGRDEVERLKSASPIVQMLAFCKAAYYQRGVHPKVREQAKDWILSNGFHLEVR